MSINLEIIESFNSEYSENILPALATFETDVTLNQTGDGTITQVNTKSFEGNRSIEIFTDVDVSLTKFTSFNFSDELSFIAKNTGAHIISLKLQNNSTIVADYEMKFAILIYVNALLVETLEHTLTISDINKGVWRTFAQNMTFNANDVVDFVFDVTCPPDVNSPNVYLYFDGFKVEVDNRNLGTPSAYSLPSILIKPLPANVVFVSTIEDFPTPTLGIINLLASTTYIIIGSIDLLGNRIVASTNNAIIGYVPFVGGSTITSTGLAGSNYIITATSTFRFEGVGLIGGAGNRGLYFNNIANTVLISLSPMVGFDKCIYIENALNVLIDRCNIRNNGIEINGAVGFLNLKTCPFSQTVASTSVLINATASFSNRIIIEECSFDTFTGGTGIDVSSSATIAGETYAINHTRFIGSGTALAGVLNTSNKALFYKNIGITNNAVNGQMYMQNNATATTIAATNTWVKVAGTTTASSDNSKYTHSNNRLTNDAVIERKYLISVANLNYTAGNNNVCKFGFYDSRLGAVRVPSQTESTTSGVGVAEQIAFQCVVTHSLGDYIEVWCQNTTAITNITVKNLNVIITEIQ